MRSLDETSAIIYLSRKLLYAIKRANFLSASWRTLLLRAGKDFAVSPSIFNPLD
jgi:hypothetical protein